MGTEIKPNISLNKVIEVLSSVVPNSREIISFKTEEEVVESKYDISKHITLTFSVNTFGLNNESDFKKIVNTLRYCGLTNITRIGYSDKSSILLEINIDVTNLNVYYEYNEF